MLLFIYNNYLTTRNIILKLMKNKNWIEWNKKQHLVRTINLFRWVFVIIFNYPLQLHDCLYFSHTQWVMLVCFQLSAISWLRIFDTDY